MKRAITILTLAIAVITGVQASRHNGIKEGNMISGHVIEADTEDDIPYANVVQIAKHFIDWIGGFEKFAEWGLV